jgi:hypothetical protein
LAFSIASTLVHDRRRILHFNVTRHPSSLWIATSAGVPHRRRGRHNRVYASTQPAADTNSKSHKPAEKPSAPGSEKKAVPESFVSAYGKWTLVLALLALCVVAGIGWMIYLLLHLIAKMLEEMGKSAKDTHAVAVATKAQADSTRALAENALDQAKTSTAAGRGIQAVCRSLQGRRRKLRQHGQLYR